MTTSKDVFAKRKAGLLDEAYQMALQRMAAPDKDDWDDKALGWCLVDLIKRASKAGSQEHLGHYRQQLEAIAVPENDDVLTKQRQFAISLCNPDGQLADEARQLSKSGKNTQAANIYRKLLIKTPTDRELGTSLGWELYRISKELLGKGAENLLPIKQNLNEYLKLNIEKPSLLHSLILQIAAKFAGAEQFSMVAFSRIWGLEHLRSDDWDRFVTNDGKELPALAERVIQHASKEAAKVNDQKSLTYIVPHLDKAILIYPDNIWLSLNKAKALLGLDRSDEALEFALEVTKAKSSDYWTWGLLGDISATTDKALSLSCYCKALLCASDDRFSGKVRLKLAMLLIDCGYLKEAKYEINYIFLAKQKDGNKIPAELESLIAQDWYTETLLPRTNEEFYLSQKAEAENLLFSQLPWVAANVGDIFTIPGKENKPRRVLYLKTTSDPIEVSIPESKFTIQRGVVGGAINIKGEWDSQKRFQVYVIADRESDEAWDVFSERIGVVDNVNQQKMLIHFLVDKNIGGIVPFSDLDTEYEEADAILVRLSKYTTKDGARYRVLSAKKSNLPAPQSLRKEFLEPIRVSDTGLGFTSTDIFITPNLVTMHHLRNDDLVEGVALLSFNKKRGEWGWKAVSVKGVKQVEES